MQLKKLTGLVLLCLTFLTSGLVAQENKFSLSSYGDELSTEPHKFFYFDELDGVLFLNGTIEKGMYTNFRQAIAENKIHTIVLNSLGGDVEEGLNIAGTVFDKGIKTYIPRGYECYSACSFIFLAGSEKYALGELGVHQAAFADDVSKEKASIGSITTVSQLTTADILLRLGEFNTPRFVEQRMLRTAPDDMYVFNEKELNKLGNLDVSNNNKALFKNIDKFIDDLQAYYAKQDCDNDLKKCTSTQLCKRAAENKSWNKTPKASVYVDEAKRKGLSCGVPIPVCPENIMKCNEEYLCTYGTTGLNTALSWLNNSFADEAKKRKLSCGVVEKSRAPSTCITNPSKCNTLSLCDFATVNLSFGPIWKKSTYWEKHVTEAKRRGLSCDVKNSRKCIEDVKKCTVRELCNNATVISGSSKRWVKSNTALKNNLSVDLVNVAEDGAAIISGTAAKPNSGVRLLVNGKELEVVQPDNSGMFAILTTLTLGKKTLELRLEDTSDNTIKSYNTIYVIPNKISKNKAPEIIFEEPGGTGKYSNEAQKRGLSCGVKIKTEVKKKTCEQDYRKCTYTELCQIATKGSGASKTWQTDLKYKLHVNSAKNTSFSCGIKDHQIPSKMTCTSDAKNCSNQQLCERATSDLNGVKVWDDRNDFISYALEAKKRFLNCGIYEKFNLAFPDFTEYGESNNEINDQIRTSIKDKLLETQSFNEIIVNNGLNRSFNMPVNYSGWQKIGIDFLITGSINIQGNKLSFKYRLFDILHEKPFGKIINFDTKVQSLDAMSSQATKNIKKQFSEYLNSLNNRDTIKTVQEELLKAGCKIGIADGVIGTKTRTALKEITQKLKINYSDSLAITPSYILNLLKIIKSTDISEYWCSSNYDAALKLLNNNKYKLAVLEFDKIINALPNNSLTIAAHYFKGEAYTGMKDWKSALKSYLKSYELNPAGKYSAKALKASYQTALMPLNENNYELAIKQFSSLINVIPNGPILSAAHYSKGEAYSGLKLWKSAGKSYLESFRSEPDGKYAAKALMNVGMSLGKMQKIDEACNILSRVEIRFPRNRIVEEVQYEMQILGCS